MLDLWWSYPDWFTNDYLLCFLPDVWRNRQHLDFWCNGLLLNLSCIFFCHEASIVCTAADSQGSHQFSGLLRHHFWTPFLLETHPRLCNVSVGLAWITKVTFLDANHGRICILWAYWLPFVRNIRILRIFEWMILYWNDLKLCCKFLVLQSPNYDMNSLFLSNVSYIGLGVDHLDIVCFDLT